MAPEIDGRVPAGGTVAVNGTMTVNQGMALYSSTVGGLSSLTVGSAGTFTLNSDSVTSEMLGEIDNQGTFNHASGELHLTNSNTGTITNRRTISNNGTTILRSEAVNSGTIYNYGILETAKDLTNEGSITTYGGVVCSGSITNRDTITICGNLECTGDLTNRGSITSSGIMRTGGDFTNAGTFINEIGAALRNTPACPTPPLRTSLPTKPARLWKTRGHFLWWITVVWLTRAALPVPVPSLSKTI